MPTSQEVVGNRPLSGPELRTIMIKQFTDMLDRDGMFANHIAYSRVGFKLRYELKLDNPLYPKHENTRESPDPPKSAVHPIDKVVSPKTMGENTKKAGFEREMMINSPNQARLVFELPVIIQRKNLVTGIYENHPVTYDRQSDTPDIPFDQRDISREVA